MSVNKSVLSDIIYYNLCRSVQNIYMLAANFNINVFDGYIEWDNLEDSKVCKSVIK